MTCKENKRFVKENTKVDIEFQTDLPHTYMHVYIYAYMYTDTRRHTLTEIHSQLYITTQVHIYIYAYTCAFIHLYRCVNVRIPVDIQIDRYTQIQLHT